MRISRSNAARRPGTWCLPSSDCGAPDLIREGFLDPVVTATQQRLTCLRVQER